jgi:hypothetical protein
MIDNFLQDEPFPGVDVMITIFDYFWRKNWRLPMYDQIFA